MMFKQLKVYVLFDDKGRVLVQNNLAAMKYQLDQKLEYRVNPSHIFEIDDAKLIRKGSNQSSREKPLNHSPEEGAISIYTDGACTGNPGPAGIGIFFKYGKREREISRYLGHATNNIAELTAIKVALREIKQPELPVRLYTDSKYCWGVLTQGWKSTRNLPLTREIKEEMKRFNDLKILKVKGHIGLDENERADRLAKKAVNENK